MDKNQLKSINKFFEVNPAELESFDEFAENLESILNGTCAVWEYEGELTLFEIKARVANVRGMQIDIYLREHAPPHFHVRSANIDASFLIEDCSILEGTVSDNDHNKIRYWHRHAKPLLIEKWNLLRPTNCLVGPYKGS